MADVSGKFFLAKKVRTGVGPSSPGILIGDTQTPVNPPGSGGAADFVPLARVITINGNAQDLSADRTYNVGTVTSVGLTMPAAFTVANSPVTGAGTIGVTGAGTTADYIRGDGSLAAFPGLTGFVPYTGANQTVNLNTQQLQAGHTTLTTNGSTETLTIAHTSGSGVGVNITKGGNNEGLRVNKTSGSGNAATIIGTLEATTLKKTGGTASQFLKADGSVDSSTYGTGTVTSVGLSSATSGVTIGSTPVTTSGTITLAIATASGSQNGLLSSTDWTTFNSKQNALTNPVTGTGASGQVAYFTGTSAISSESNLFWDATNDRLGIGTNSPNANLDIQRVFGDSNDILRLGSNQNFYFGFARNNSNGALQIQGNQTGSNNILLAPTSGIVGIGTTLPSGIINGKGLVIFDSLFPRLILQNTITGTGTGAFSGLYLIGNTMYVQNSSVTGDINFAVNSGSDAMVFTSDGNLLINTTTNSGGKLRVDGDVFINNTSNAQIGFNTTGALNSVGAYQYFNRSGLNKWTAGMGPFDGSNDYQIVTGSTKALNLTVSTGAAIFASNVTANSFIKSGGTSSQFLKADGSVDSTTYVPTSRTITINGTSQNLSADRTYNVGTVTSVTATAGTGISISGSPITSSGTLTITNTAPDQVVSLTASTGISVSGSYPNFTITNTSPASAGITGSGTSGRLAIFTGTNTIGTSNINAVGSTIYNENPVAGQFAWQFNGSTTTGQSYGANVVAGTNASDIGFKVMNAAASINYFVVRGDGNIGIGSASPTMSLSIRGDKQGDVNEGQGQLLIDGNSAYNASNGSTLSASGAGSAIIFRGKYNSGGAITGLAGISGSKENTTDGDYGGNLRFYTRTNGSNNPPERMRITAAATRPGADNAYSLGASGIRWSAVWAANGTIQTSDEREKKDIINSDLGLDFVTKLRPVSFKWKVGQNVETIKVVKDNQGKPILDEEGNEKTESVITPRQGKRTHYGLIAQEVEEILGGKDFGGFIYDKETDTKGLRYDQFVPVLIKSIQELKQEIDTLKS